MSRPGRADTRDCTNYAVGDATVDGPMASVQVNNAGAPAGTYTVVWQVVYGDGHADSQMFTFTASNAVPDEPAEPSQAPTEPSTSSPTATAPAETAPSETTTPDPGAGTDDGSDDATTAPAIVDDEGPLSTPAVIAIVGGALVLMLIAFIIVMIARARRS